MADVQRDLGKMEAQLDNHDSRLTRIEAKLDHVVSMLDRAGGSWKALVMAGAAASAITAAAMKVLDFMGWHK